jgi:hypothetical protein
VIADVRNLNHMLTLSQELFAEPSQGTYLHPISDGVVPGSDGAGTVKGTGSNVTRSKTGDRVVTSYNQARVPVYGRPLTVSAAAKGLGGSKDD